MGDYAISQICPSDKRSLDRSVALLQQEGVARALRITDRYVGEEPTSQVTGLYNEIMIGELPKAGVACHVIPRTEATGTAISASTVRQALQAGNWDLLETLVPPTTYRYCEPVRRLAHPRVASQGGGFGVRSNTEMPGLNVTIFWYDSTPRVQGGVFSFSRQPSSG